MAKFFLNRCPLIVTAQRELQFKPEELPATERRFRTYSFESLWNPKNGQRKGYATTQKEIVVKKKLKKIVVSWWAKVCYQNASMEEDEITTEENENVQQASGR